MDKTNQNDVANHQAALLDAANALNELRDSLVRVSLCLQDYQFRMDTMPRRTVTKQAQDLIDRVRGAPCSGERAVD